MHYLSLWNINILDGLCVENSNSKVYKSEHWEKSEQKLSRFNLRGWQGQHRRWKTSAVAVWRRFSNSSFWHPCNAGAEPENPSWKDVFEMLEMKASRLFTSTWTFSFLDTRSLSIFECRSFSLISPSSCLLLLPSSTLQQNQNLKDPTWACPCRCGEELLRMEWTSWRSARSQPSSHKTWSVGCQRLK